MCIYESAVSICAEGANAADVQCLPGPDYSGSYRMQHLFIFIFHFLLSDIPIEILTVAIILVCLAISELY